MAVLSSLTIAHTWDGQALPAAAQTRIQLRETASGLEIALEAPFYGDPAPPGPTGSRDRLWEFEVVEVFVAEANRRDRPRYTEVEVSPHGHYLVIQLEGVRQPVTKGSALIFEAHIEGNRWRGQATVPWESLPPKPWTANAYALHGQPPHRHHQAHAAVPGPKPDFHQPACFVPLPF